MLEHWIWLARRSGMGDYLRARLIRHFSSAEEVYKAGETTLRAVEDLTADAVASLLDKDLSREQEILSRCMEHGIQVICPESPEYPARLKQIYDLPMVLYVLGALPDVDNNAVIGVVGTRKPSAYGASAGWRMGNEIASGGGIVVSGLAEGVDGMAMRGALAAGAPVIGVLGCGIDRVYPRSNADLFAQTRQYGCILSEYPPGTLGAKWTFPRRNRIISGLSRGIVVVEAPEGSGSLITVKHALDQGRDVFAVPGNVDLPGFQGSNRLLREGAEAVSCGWDVLETYADQYPGRIHRPAPARYSSPAETEKLSPRKKETSAGKPDKKDIDKTPKGEYSDRTDAFAGLSPEEQAIVRCLTAGERPVDEIIAETGMGAGKVLALMTVLEIRSIIVRRPGKRAALKS